MANPPYIQEANSSNFKSLVLENSDRGPVMVFFWSPRAGPCMKLMPRLIRFADEYCGKILLVLLDTDAHGRLAKDEYSVTSVPTVKFFRNGKVSETIHGAESDREFRRVIDKFVLREASIAQINASRAYHQEGNVDQACALLAKAALDDPENASIALDLDKLLIPNYFAGAMEQLFEIVKRDRGFREDAGRKGLIAYFQYAGKRDRAGEQISFFADRSFAMSSVSESSHS